MALFFRVLSLVFFIEVVRAAHLANLVDWNLRRSEEEQNGIGMYFEVASKLVVPTATNQFSQAVSMDGANAVQIESTLFVYPGGSVVATLQGSNDLENWDSTGITGGVITFDTALGYKSAQGTAIAYRYVRLKFAASTGTAIISAGINTASL